MAVDMADMADIMADIAGFFEQLTVPDPAEEQVLAPPLGLEP